MDKKLKVAFVVHEFPVLSETFIINQATGLIDRGCEVDIYTDRLGDTDKVHPDIHRYDLLDRTRVLPAVPQNYAVRVIKAIAIIAKHGYRYPRKVARSLNVFRRGIRAASLWSLFTELPPLDLPSYDIIHAQFGNLGFRSLLLKDLSKDARLVVMFRGFDISQQVQANGPNVYSSLFKQADFFLTNCDFFRQRLLALGCSPDKIRVHYSGLDCSKFTPSARSKSSSEKVRIAATGRLVEKKGFEYSIRAVAKVAERYPHITFDIIGDGPLRNELSALIKSLNMRETIHLLGWRDEQEIIDILTRSHLFVAPSVTAAKGNQDAPINVLKEAMALGLPVVSTTHGGIPELVEDGISGFLVPERDATAIAHALTTLIEHPERWAGMGAAGRSYVETHYNLDLLNDRLLELYHQLLAGPIEGPKQSLPSVVPAT
ncbi:glycosyl transferase, group 1 family protein [Synechococcus sp. PCC 7335]|uniref:glycosyltransferase n=1 Tax=Synechococcus sp. (strain ATCC 29403 / PCC 7335) TaxID=91464 RepID=UPI00017ECB49|nr:glycosyltransferase [Synechococcus sp. PCC 7335]EDX86713.1 glycosyl transferase, group 1 family protein [Synechococcus sp. PCC 7335]